mmetsp:Transcript_10621/g.32080  ORF Transcript_10621/g.32080 Transcript_10621/m.32080 type:complete len:298 (+) Transcript_10621:209-1102(+)
MERFVKRAFHRIGRSRSGLPLRSTLFMSASISASSRGMLWRWLYAKSKLVSLPSFFTSCGRYVMLLPRRLRKRSSGRLQSSRQKFWKRLQLRSSVSSFVRWLKVSGTALSLLCPRSSVSSVATTPRFGGTASISLRERLKSMRFGMRPISPGMWRTQLWPMLQVCSRSSAPNSTGTVSRRFSLRSRISRSVSMPTSAGRRRILLCARFRNFTRRRPPSAGSTEPMSLWLRFRYVRLRRPSKAAPTPRSRFSEASKNSRFTIAAMDAGRLWRQLPLRMSVFSEKSPPRSSGRCRSWFE